MLRRGRRVPFRGHVEGLEVEGEVPGDGVADVEAGVVLVRALVPKDVLGVQIHVPLLAALAFGAGQGVSCF